MIQKRYYVAVLDLKLLKQYPHTFLRLLKKAKRAFNSMVDQERLYAAWCLEDSLRYTELKHTGEESEAEHTLHAAWWLEDSPQYTEAQTHR
jgi:hypothetical protein